MNWRDQVVNEALTWLGTPYVAKARVKGVGTDCGGFLYEVYNPIFGPFASMPTDYSPDWALHNDRERYLEFIMPYIREVETPLPGDMTLYKVGQAYSHAAIFLNDKQYIHAWGRTREGKVTLSSPRVMAHLGKNGFKHFTPKAG